MNEEQQKIQGAHVAKSYQNPQYIKYVNKSEKPKRDYSSDEIVFAWICFVMGYLFCRVFPVVLSPFGGFLFVILLFCVTAVFLKLKGAKFSVKTIMFAVMAIAFSSSLIISSNSFLYWLAYVFALASYCCFVWTACENGVKIGFSGFIAADYINAVFCAPIASVSHVWKAAFSGKTAGGIKKLLLRVTGGIAVAIIPTAIACALLSYDAGFNKIMGEIFDFDIGNIFSHLGSVILGFVVGMYIFGLYISSVDKYSASGITEEGYKNQIVKMRAASSVFIASASIPLLFVYVVFFISQWKYYVSGFTGVLPEEFSYAEYAREGFFQLCAVAFINLAVLIAINLIMKRKSEKLPIFLKVLNIIYSVFTLILISTAIAKMVMYIQSYGLTQKRVYSTCAMVVLAILFVLIIIKQFVCRISPAAFSLVAGVLLFAVLSIGNVDAMIAEYNVDRYIDGSLPTVDIDAMDDLGDAAIPELVRLYKYMEENGYETEYLYFKTESYLKESASKIISEKENDDSNALERFFSFNTPSYMAEKALGNIGLLKVE